MNSFITINNGRTDASPLLQQLLNRGGTIEIPQGEYRITTPLQIPSDTTIIAHPQAHFILCGDTPRAAHHYLLTNSGSRNITITGGIWDGNNQGPSNAKGDIFDLTRYSGCVLNFCGVENLTLRGLTVTNSVTYFVRMAKIDGFTIEDIAFVSDKIAHNQDGLHFNGWCRNGIVRRITALSLGQTNDDLIALNADDSMERVENVGMVRGDIENILFEDLYAQDCHTIIRLLSVDHAIRNITIRRVYAGFRCYAINADGARYCRTPLFKENDWPAGVGCIENVRIEDMTCRPTSGKYPALMWESQGKNVCLKNFRLLKEDFPQVNALEAKNIVSTVITADGIDHPLTEKSQQLALDDFTDLTISVADKK